MVVDLGGEMIMKKKVKLCWRRGKFWWRDGGVNS